MATVPISKELRASMREELRKAVCKDVPNPQEDTKLLSAVREEHKVVDEKIRADKLEFLTHKSTGASFVYLRTEENRTALSIYAVFNYEATVPPYGNPIIPANYRRHYPRTVERFEQLAVLITAAEDKYAALEDKVNLLLDNYPSLNALLKDHPTLIGYVEQKFRDRLEAKTTKAAKREKVELDTTDLTHVAVMARVGA